MKRAATLVALLFVACTAPNEASDTWALWHVDCYPTSCIASLRLTDAAWPEKHLLCDETGCYCTILKSQHCHPPVPFTLAGMKKAYDNGCCRTTRPSK